MRTRSTLCRAASQGLLAGILTLIVNLPAAAQTAAATPPTATTEPVSTASPDWQFVASLYLWTPAITGTTTTGDDVDVSISDVLSNLDIAFMGGLQARKGRLSLNLDVVYSALSESIDMGGNLVGSPVTAEVDAEVELLVPTVFVGYTVVEANMLQLDVLAGVRYTRADVNLDFSVDGPLSLVDRSRSESFDLVDGIVGVRGQVDLSEKWFLPFYADVGAGESSLTWQAFAGIGYRLSRNVDAVVGYRHLSWSFDDRKVLDDLALSGPLAGVKIRF